MCDQKKTSTLKPIPTANDNPMFFGEYVKSFCTYYCMGECHCDYACDPYYDKNCFEKREEEVGKG